ncbi:metal-dependent hydrolase [Pyxidicoccus parkwayensis]|uniref:Metal-dependent hydrolase n=1 Tax=Pyxidicoccus parkwayensis TaxID=2813578 RepID=A0ABX7NUK0_9BACT|nr:metal-dependent hydrolase [Pyxidicoccus parkwaysis]QSQ22601.1 metal-dependent hydrolase [Pyxidicoccus parkwaysis]
MASIGHVAVGMALGRYEAGGASARRLAGAMALLSLLALLPDADVVGFKFGVAYAAPWGHRGASHSLVFATGMALVAMGVARALRAPVARWTALTFLAVASHGLLDSLTDGGLGAALLWPFSNERFFAPVHPLPVSPIGTRMLSARGLYVVGVELLAFIPFWAYALWPRGRRLES